MELTQNRVKQVLHIHRPSILSSVKYQFGLEPSCIIVFLNKLIILIINIPRPYLHSLNILGVFFHLHIIMNWTDKNSHLCIACHMHFIIFLVTTASLCVLSVKIFAYPIGFAAKQSPLHVGPAGDWCLEDLHNTCELTSIYVDICYNVVVFNYLWLFTK